MTNRTLIALAVAAMLVLAGCSGGTSTTAAPTDDTTAAETSTATETTAASTETTTEEPTTTTQESQDCEHRAGDDDDIVQESGVCLGFDADQVYRNVLEMAGEEDFDEGPSVRSLSPEETDPYSFSDFGFDSDSFQAVMGIAPEGTPSVYVAGFASPGGAGGNVEVVLRYIGNQSSDAYSPGRTQNASEAEVTAAHEFLHAMQFYKGYQERLARNMTMPGVSVNNEDLSLALTEGSAVYFESEYQEEYMGREDISRSVSQWRNRSAFSMYTLGPYVMGERYTKFRVNSTAEFQKLYDNPAHSMEQVMHNYMPSEELPLNISVTGSVSSDWSTPSSAKTKGELFLRSALRSGVSGEKAAAGATGWGQDGLITFQNTSYSAAGNYKYGYAWAVRYDNASEGIEGHRIFQEWLESKGEIGNGLYGSNTDSTFRMVQLSNETIVIVAGHEDFVTQAAVSGNTTTVEIEHTSTSQLDDESADEDEDDESSSFVGSGFIRAEA